MRSAAPGADIHKTGTIVERLPSDRSGGISIHDSVIVGRDATASGKATFISMSTDGMQNLCYLLFTREARGLTGYSLGCVLAQFSGAGANVQSVTFLSPDASQFDLYLDVPEVNSLLALSIDTPSHVLWGYRQ